MAGQRERSPRRGGKGRGGEGGGGVIKSAIPLVDSLALLGILDEKAVDFLNKAPVDIAADVLLCLGPEVRNPSGFVTNRLKAYKESSQASYVGGGFLPILNGKTTQPSNPWTQMSVNYHDGGKSQGKKLAPLQAPHRQPPTSALLQHIGVYSQKSVKRPDNNDIEVHHNGEVHTIYWESPETAAAMLVAHGILDEGSADFLIKAPEHIAKEIVSCLGPDVRNPSAFVTTKLKEFNKSGECSLVSDPKNLTPVRVSRPPLQSSKRPDNEGIEVHHNGQMHTIYWESLESASTMLFAHGILDKGSADFLNQAPEHVAKEIVSCLGPEVRNPSAFVTRKLKEYNKSGAASSSARERVSEGETFMVPHNGSLIPLQWSTKEQAVADLQFAGVLDDLSSDFLMKATEHVAKDIISSLGPDIRNPSAFITRRCRETNVRGETFESRQQASSQHPTMTVTVFHNGVEHTIQCPTRDVALGQLMQRGVLDEKCTDFLKKLPEEAAWDIISRIGPDVRNPSAFVTMEAKKSLSAFVTMRHSSLALAGR